jgi:hypothetical protein
MADLVPQGGRERKRFWDKGFNRIGGWRLGAEVTGGPYAAWWRRVRNRRAVNDLDDDDETGYW